MCFDYQCRFSFHIKCVHCVVCEFTLNVDTIVQFCCYLKRICSENWCFYLIIMLAEYITDKTSVLLSTRLFVCHIVALCLNECTSSCFLTSCSDIILVFEVIPPGGVNYTEVGKIFNFRPKSLFNLFRKLRYEVVLHRL